MERYGWLAVALFLSLAVKATTRAKSKRWKSDVSLGQTFGVIGPKFALSW